MKNQNTNTMENQSIETMQNQFQDLYARFKQTQTKAIDTSFWVNQTIKELRKVKNLQDFNKALELLNHDNCELHASNYKRDSYMTADKGITISKLEDNLQTLIPMLGGHARNLQIRLDILNDKLKKSAK